MPDFLTDAMVAPLFVAEEDDRGVRYRRATAAPRGSDAPILAADAQVVSPFEPLGAPDPFPLEWLERRPQWVDPAGEGVRVVLDGPETGRAAGYIRLHGTCYQDGTGACRMPPEVPYDAFHRGDAQVIDEHGQVKEVAVGAIAIIGGHSSRGGAREATDAIKFIDQPEKAKLRGVLVEDSTGLLFLGCARSDLTRVEATMINQSDTSGEWWPLFEHGDDGQVGLVGHDLIGIALVTGGAFRKSIPERFRVLAAALGRDLFDDEVEMMFNETSEPKASCPCGGHAESCSCEPAATLEVELPTIMFAAVPMLPEPAPAELPMLASPTDDAVNELRSKVDDQERIIETLRSDLDVVMRELTQLRAADLTEAEITLPDRVDQAEEVQRAIEERLAKLEAKTADATVAPSSDSGGPDSSSESSPVQSQAA